MALSAKQKAFINAYLATSNATEAARQAGYKGDDATLASVGWENLRKPEIADAISKRTSESAMSADEVLKRLAEHARGSMADFVKVNDRGQPYFDLEAAQSAGKLHLVKKLKTKTRSINLGKDDEDESNTDEEQADSLITEVTIEFELYDAQSALTLLGKHHKLFVDKLDITHSGSVDFTSDEAAKAKQELDDFDRQRNAVQQGRRSNADS
jgi:phage terminase small subunit